MLRPGLVSRHGGPAPAFSPADVSGLAVWLKADAGTGASSDGDLVTTWTDQSGNSRSPTQATSAAKPTWQTGEQNGLPGVLFDGVDDVLSYVAGGAFLTGTDITLAVVRRRMSTTSNYGRTIGLFAGSTLDYSNLGSCAFSYEATNQNEVATRNYGNGPPLKLVEQSSAPNGSANVGVYWFDNTNGNFRYNGAAASPTPSGAISGSFNVDRFTVGAGDTWASIGAFANYMVHEVVLYDNDIGSTARTQLEGYLNGRWAVY